MPFYPIKKNDMRVTDGTSEQGVIFTSGTLSGTFGSLQILSTPGFNQGCPSIFTASNAGKGALERIPGKDGFVQTLAGSTPRYPGGFYNALHPYDEVRNVNRIQVQSSSFFSQDQNSSNNAQYRQHIQSIWYPKYFETKGARYDNSVQNNSTLLLSRPIMTPSWAFDSKYANDYDVSTGFTSFSWVNIRQDDPGSIEPFVTSSSGFTSPTPPADISVSKGLSPVLTILSGTWSGFSTGSSLASLQTVTGLTPPFVCFSWGVNRTSGGERRLYIMAATGSGQTDVYSAYSKPLNIDLNEWNHLGVRWQNDINNRTGSFVVNGELFDEFVLDVSSISMPSPSSSLYLQTDFSSSLISNVSGFNASSSLDGIITLGNLGQFRYSGSLGGNDYPQQLGSSKLIELHDIALFNKFVELEFIEPYCSGTVRQSGSSDPVFYVPVATPKLSSFNQDPFVQLGVRSKISNSYEYYDSNISTFYNSSSVDLGVYENHILQLSQLGGNVELSTPSQSGLDNLALGGSILGGIFSNINQGRENGIQWREDLSPLLGFGTQWFVNTNLIDVSSGAPALSAFFASGTIKNASDSRTFVCPCPMDFFVSDTSSSYQYSTQRIWPSDHHDFLMDARKLNTWVNSVGSRSNISGANRLDASTMGITYNGWEYRNRIPSAFNNNLVRSTQRSVVYYTTGSSTILDPLNGLLSIQDHFINSAFNINQIFYVPKVIFGDKIKRGSPRLKVQACIAEQAPGDNNQRVAFGQFFSTNNDVSIDPSFQLEFVDNGFGGMVRGKKTDTSYNDLVNIFYERGVIVQKHPSLFWIGNDNSTQNSGNNAWELEFSSSNKVFIREMELNIPAKKSLFPISSRSLEGTVTGVDIYDSGGNILEKVRLAQPVSRLSGSAITIRTFTVF